MYISSSMFLAEHAAASARCGVSLTQKVHRRSASCTCGYDWEVQVTGSALVALRCRQKGQDFLSCCRKSVSHRCLSWSE